MRIARSARSRPFGTVPRAGFGFVPARGHPRPFGFPNLRDAIPMVQFSGQVFDNQWVGYKKRKKWCRVR